MSYRMKLDCTDLFKIFNDMSPCILYNFVIHHHFFSYKNQYNKYTTFWLLSTKSLLVANCSIDRSKVHRSIARYRTVDRWPYFHWFNKSHDIDVTMSKRRPDSRT